MSERRDLTAILLAAGADTVEVVHRAVAAGPYGDVWLRAKPLPALALLQVELYDAGGMPRLDPHLVQTLSSGGRKASFVHVNWEAKQAVVHAFHDGAEIEGWAGEPSELTGPLLRATGRSLAEILDADDGSRVGIGAVASDTMALVRGRKLVAP